MGKKRAYCPYCDVFLVHNSLRSRRDHALGWKHRCSVQAYYSRFLPQHFQSGGKPKFDEELNTDQVKPTVSTAPAPQPAALSLIHPPAIASAKILGLNSRIAPPPSFKPPVLPSANKPPSIAIRPPTIGNAGGPPSIRPPTIGNSGGPPPIGIKPPTIGNAGGPPRIGPPPISPIKPPMGGPPSISPIKPPMGGPPPISPIKPLMNGPPPISPIKPAEQ